MALLGWIFISHFFRPFLPADQIDGYIAGLILLAAAPCTAMVFVWSNLVDGEPHFTLSQVALNDSIMVIAFAPIVALLLGLSSITVPWNTLLLSVVLYIVVPVIVAQLWRRALLAQGGTAALAATLRRIRPALAFGAAADAGAARSGCKASKSFVSRSSSACSRADSDTGLFQCGARLLAQSQPRRRMVRGGTLRAHRRQQLLRAGRRDGDCAVRLPVRARRWQRSSAFSSRCRSCFPSCKSSVARGRGTNERERRKAGARTDARAASLKERFRRAG